MKKTNLILILVLSFVGLSAKADMSKTTIFSLNTMYINREYNINGTATQSKETDTEIKAIRVDRKFAFGGIYSMSANDSSSSSRTSYGATLGYFSEKDFYLLGHYFISSKFKLNSGTEYTDGSGYGVDLGFLSKVTPSFLVGLVISQRNLKYTKVNLGGSSSAADVSTNELVPLFTFAVAFQ